MIELEGRLLIDGTLVPGRLAIEGERVAGVEPAPAGTTLPAAPIVAPGLVDLHVHGFGGCDPLEDLAGMARALARAGTTAFQPTLFPRAPERLAEDLRGVASARVEGPAARVLGCHLEGPFLNRAAAGALPADQLADPSTGGLRTLLEAVASQERGLATMTLAPELPGAAELVEELVCSGVRVSLGHSLARTDDARAAVRAGASAATHLFNAMGPWHHRDVGLAGIALLERALFAEIIGDLVHVGREAFELALAARGPDGLCLVSDALPGAGTGCERFHWHGREHLVRGRTAYWPPPERGEPRLAGSACSQLEMVRILVGTGVLGPAEALTMASRTPARALGREDLGILRPGALADLLVLEPRNLTLERVLVGGRDLGSLV